MKLKRMSHVHGWMDDPDEVNKVVYGLLGFSVEERDFGPVGFPALSSITGNGRENVWIEFFGETTPGGLAFISTPRRPHLIALDYQVDDLDAATAELKEAGIDQTAVIPMGETRQAWYSSANGFYIELSEFEGDDLLAPLHIEEFPTTGTLPLEDRGMGVVAIDHVTGWTENAELAAKFFGQTYGFEASVELLAEDRVKVARFSVPGDRAYWELIQKLDSAALGAVDGWDTPGLFGLGLKVKDVDRAVEYLGSKGVLPVWESKRNGKRHVMFSCENTYGVCLEVCE